MRSATSFTRAEFVRRMLAIGRRCGEIPVYGSPEWEALDRLDPRRFASVVRAAECWRLEGEPEAIRRRLADDDLLVRLRLRHMIGDLSGWPFQRHHEIARSRAEWGDPRYRRSSDDDEP